MQTNDLKRNTKNPKKKTIGRGGKRGKTSGRGHKGQGQHGSHGMRPQMRDIIKKFPKLRGHGKNRARTVNSGVSKPLVINLNFIDSNFENDSVVSPKSLVKAGLISLVKGKIPSIKILSNGEITKKVKVIDCEISKSAEEKILKVGGTVSK